MSNKIQSSPSPTPIVPTDTSVDSSQQKPDPVCPVVDAMLQDQLISQDKDERVSFFGDGGLYGGLRRMGLRPTLAAATLFAGVLGNGPKDIVLNIIRGNFSVPGLRGGLTDHAGDSGVLRHGHFDEERFQELISYSSDGKTLSMAELAESVIGSAIRDEDNSGIMTSVVEFSALASIFGKVDSEGTRRIDIDVMRSLYQDKKIPENFAYEKTGLLKRMGQIAQIAVNLPFSNLGVSKKGLFDALTDLVREKALENPSSLQGMRSGVCPNMDQQAPQPTSEAEIVQLHNQIDT